MKKNLLAMTLLIATSIILIPSCKKKSADETVSPTTVNVLCDGNGSSSYLPMVLNNSWTYNYYIATQIQSVHPKLVVTGTSSHNSKNYFEIEDQTSAMSSGTLEFREDATTHNIYYYYSGSEYLHVPATPTLNQSWSCSYSNTRKVTNLNATITTPGCSYTGLLEISEYNSSSVLQKKEYFKKGIGMVYREIPNTFFGGYNKYNLTDITLN